MRGHANNKYTIKQRENIKKKSTTKNGTEMCSIHNVRVIGYDRFVYEAGEEDARGTRERDVRSSVYMF